MRVVLVAIGILASVYACGNDDGGGGNGSTGGTAGGGAASHGGSSSLGGAGSDIGPGGAAGTTELGGSDVGAGGTELGGSGDGDGGAHVSGAGAGGDTGLGDNPILEQTKFLDYGKLRISFKRPIAVASLAVTLEPALPAKLVVTQLKAVDETTVEALLGNYHLPRDYVLHVAGKLSDGTPFESQAVLSGLGNGSRVAFLTKEQGSGDLRTWAGVPAGVTVPRDAADAICQGEAEQAGFRGRFVAFLSEQAKYDAGCRALGLDGTLASACSQPALPKDDAPWLSSTGLPLVNGASAVLTGAFQNAFSFYADGSRPLQIGVWTGTLAGAKGESGQPDQFTVDCRGFSSAVATDHAEVTEFIDQYLLKYGEFGSNCAIPHGLLCLQVGGEFFAPAHLHEVAGKRAFVSQGKLTGKMAFGGQAQIAAADALCQAEALAAQYARSDSFYAYLGNSQNDALCHVLGASGKVKQLCGLDAWPIETWRRADNYPLGTPADFAAVSLTSPLWLNADGTSKPDDRPWTGAVYEGQGASDCSDWSSDVAAATGRAGTTRGVAYAFQSYTDSHCNAQQPVYCFER